MEDYRTGRVEVKFGDPTQTNNGENSYPQYTYESWTKAGASKTIRYRRSPSPKLCRLHFNSQKWIDVLREI